MRAYELGLRLSHAALQQKVPAVEEMPFRVARAERDRAGQVLAGGWPVPIVEHRHDA